MIVKHRLNLDLIKRGVTQRIDAAQDDRYSRALEIHLFANGVEFAPPEGATVFVRYKKPDGTGGAYDTLPDGSCAWSITDGVLTVALAPQVCTVAGTVELAVTLLWETAEISTFMLLVDVQASPGGTETSREYVNIKAFLPQPGNLTLGQYLMVTEVDAYGNATVIGSGAVPTVTLDAVDGGCQISVVNPNGGGSKATTILNGVDGAGITGIATEVVSDAMTHYETKTKVTVTVTPADPSLAKAYVFYIPHGKNGAQGEEGKSVIYCSWPAAGQTVLASDFSQTPKVGDLVICGDGDVCQAVTVYESGTTVLSAALCNITGPQGIQGIQGVQGEKGDKGETGPQGDRGFAVFSTELKPDVQEGDYYFIELAAISTVDKNPIPGDSVITASGRLNMVISIQNNLVQLYCIANLNGEQGPQGEIGPQGPQGETGPQGIQGEKGEDGKDGTDILKCRYASGTLPMGRARGDINGDGVLDEADKVALNDHNLGTTVITDEIALWAADITGDGSVNAGDGGKLTAILAGNVDYSQYAADHYGAWQYDSENGYFCYDISAPGMTADTAVLIVPSAAFAENFVSAIPMDGAVRFCFACCPVTQVLCRILYGGELEGVTVAEPVENSFLDAVITRGEVQMMIDAALTAAE